MRKHEEVRKGSEEGVKGGRGQVFTFDIS